MSVATASPAPPTRPLGFPALTGDPLGSAGGSHNLYQYAGGDPINQIDPDGEAIVAATVLTGAAIYVGVQALFAAGETAIESAAVNTFGTDEDIEDFSTLGAFGKNFAINLATGGIGGKVKAATTAARIGRQAGLFALRQGIEVGGDTAFDVAVNGRGLTESLIVNTAGSLIGEAGGRALQKSGLIEDVANGFLLTARQSIRSNQLNGFITFGADLRGLVQNVVQSNQVRRLAEGTERIFRERVQAISLANPGISRQKLGQLADQQTKAKVLNLARKLGVRIGDNTNAARISVPEGVRLVTSDGLVKSRIADIKLFDQHLTLELTIEEATNFAQFSVHKQDQITDFILSGFNPIVINAENVNRVFK